MPTKPNEAKSRQRGRPPRPMPADFREVFIEKGWEGSADALKTHDRSIERWLREAGKKQLVAERAAAVSARRTLRDRERRKAYRMPPSAC